MVSDGYAIHMQASSPLNETQAVIPAGIDRSGKSAPAADETTIAAAASAAAGSVAAAAAAAAAAVAAAASEAATASVATPSTAVPLIGVSHVKATTAVPTAPIVTSVAALATASTVAAALAAAAKETTAKAAAAKAPANPPSDAQALATLLNKNLNDSGQPDQFRVDPTSDRQIQQINPSNGQVVGQFAANEFPALAKSIGASGVLVDHMT
jgi:hypothetical protein